MYTMFSSCSDGDEWRAHTLVFHTSLLTAKVSCSYIRDWRIHISAAFESTDLLEIHTSKISLFILIIDSPSFLRLTLVQTDPRSVFSSELEQKVKTPRPARQCRPCHHHQEGFTQGRSYRGHDSAVHLHLKEMGQLKDNQSSTWWNDDPANHSLLTTLIMSMLNVHKGEISKLWLQPSQNWRSFLERKRNVFNNRTSPIVLHHQALENTITALLLC